MGPEWIRHNQEKGVMALVGRESLSSTHRQSLVARRVQHFNMEYACGLSFYPRHFQQSMGIVCYYNTGHFIYLHFAGNDDGETMALQVIVCDNFSFDFLLDAPIPFAHGYAELKIQWKKDTISFFFRRESSPWIKLEREADGSILSDDYVQNGSDKYRPAFTGSFVGVTCQDLTGMRQAGNIHYLRYKPIAPVESP
jgi:xylan 1,4-beta-xylosidase